MALLLMMGVTGGPEPSSLREMLQRARHPEGKVVFRAPSEAHREAMQRAVALLTGGAPACDPYIFETVGSLVGPLGLELVAVERQGVRFWVLREGAPGHWGAGVYICRCGEAVPLVVQTPHSYFDRNTGWLGYKVFIDGRARWLMSNTLARYASREGEVAHVGPHPADVAHNPVHLFQAATLGALGMSPGLLFVQLHGFDGPMREGAAILSDGRAEPQIWSERLALRWRPPGGEAQVYRARMRELGGTTNVQARAINDAGGRFLHVEMSNDLRRLLRRDRALRRPFVSALVQVASKT